MNCNLLADRLRSLAIASTMAVAALAPSVATAQPSPPVEIDSCAPIINPPSPWQSPPPTFMGIPIPIASTSSGMQISFVNEASQPATLVTFAVDDNGNQFVIRDVGTFSPGITINHSYRNGQGQSYLLPTFITPHVRCHVQSVKFADGSVWRRGQGTIAHQQPVVPASTGGSGPLSATPSRLVIDGGEQSALFLVQSSAPVVGFREHDTCNGIASIYVASIADAAATYAVKPLGPGTCTATVRNEAGAAIVIPIAVR